MAYGQRIREQVREIVAKAPSATLSQRIDNSMQEISQINGLSHTPSKFTIYKWFKEKPFGPQNSTAARSAIAKTSTPTIDSIKQMIEEAGGFISLSPLAAHTDLCKNSVAKIIKVHLQMYAFKFIKGPDLEPLHEDQRFNFCFQVTEMLEENPIWYRGVIWSDESQFEVIPPHNHQNSRCYSTEQPNVVHEEKAYPEKCLM